MRRRKTSRNLHKVSTTQTSAVKCTRCRHANQGTEDFDAGYVACKITGGLRPETSTCSVSLPMKDGEYFAFEIFDGTNCTWGDKNLTLEYVDAEK